MKSPLDISLVEDSPNDAELVLSDYCIPHFASLRMAELYFFTTFNTFTASGNL